MRVSSLLRYAAGTLPIEGYELEYGKVGTPSALVEDLLEALTAAIDELTRPVDAIKHQAKTVTVGHLPQRGRPAPASGSSRRRWPPGRPRID